MQRNFLVLVLMCLALFASACGSDDPVSAGGSVGEPEATPPPTTAPVSTPSPSATVVPAEPEPTATSVPAVEPEPTATEAPVVEPEPTSTTAPPPTAVPAVSPEFPGPTTLVVTWFETGGCAMVRACPQWVIYGDGRVGMQFPLDVENGTFNASGTIDPSMVSDFALLAAGTDIDALLDRLPVGPCEGASDGNDPGFSMPWLTERSPTECDFEFITSEPFFASLWPLAEAARAVAPADFERYAEQYDLFESPEPTRTVLGPNDVVVTWFEAGGCRRNCATWTIFGDGRVQLSFPDALDSSGVAAEGTVAAALVAEFVTVAAATDLDALIPTLPAGPCTMAFDGVDAGFAAPWLKDRRFTECDFEFSAREPFFAALRTLGTAAEAAAPR